MSADKKSWKMCFQLFEISTRASKYKSLTPLRTYWHSESVIKIQVEEKEADFLLLQNLATKISRSLNSASLFVSSHRKLYK